MPPSLNRQVALARLRSNLPALVLYHIALRADLYRWIRGGCVAVVLETGKVFLNTSAAGWNRSRADDVWGWVFETPLYLILLVNIAQAFWVLQVGDDVNRGVTSATTDHTATTSPVAPQPKSVTALNYEDSPASHPGLPRRLLSRPSTATSSPSPSGAKASAIASRPESTASELPSTPNRRRHDGDRDGIPNTGAMTPGRRLMSPYAPGGIAAPRLGALREAASSSSIPSADQVSSEPKPGQALVHSRSQPNMPTSSTPAATDASEKSTTTTTPIKLTDMLRRSERSRGRAGEGLGSATGSPNNVGGSRLLRSLASSSSALRHTSASGDSARHEATLSDADDLALRAFKARRAATAALTASGRRVAAGRDESDAILDELRRSLLGTEAASS